MDRYMNLSQNFDIDDYDLGDSPNPSQPQPPCINSPPETPQSRLNPSRPPQHPTMSRVRSRRQTSEGDCGSSNKDFGNLTSWVWEHMEPYWAMNKEGKQVRRGRCKYCGKNYGGDGGKGTSTMIRHLKNDHNIEKTTECTNDNTIQTQIGRTGKSFHYNPDAYREAFAKYVAATDQPLNMGGCEYFEELVQTTLQPAFKRFSRNTTRNDVIKVFKNMKTELKENIHRCTISVALTADIWSGRAKQDYICVNAHYLDKDWKLNKSLLGFKLMELNHSGLQIYQQILGVLQDYGIADKIISLTLDNASANSKAVDFFISDKDFSNFINLKFFHQRCVCHIINLIVKSGMKIIKNDIDQIRECLQWITGSNIRNQQFHNFCIASGRPPKTFALDMPIRWNSTYLMLESCLPYYDLITLFVTSNGGPHTISYNDWSRAKKFHTFLSVFYDATLKLSGIYYVTSIWVIHKILEIAILFNENENDPILAEPIRAMTNKFKKYWLPIPDLYCIAATLDPRVKMSGLADILDGLDEMLAEQEYHGQLGKVQDSLRAVFAQYQCRYGVVESTQQDVQLESQQSRKGKSSWSWLRDRSNKRKTPGESSSSASASAPAAPDYNELQLYLTTKEYIPNDPDTVDNFDILQYWQSRQSTYPILSRLAMDVFSIPVSTISSEQTFSSSGRIISDTRSRLTPKMVEVLVCVRDWERSRRRDQYEMIDNTFLDSFQNCSLDDTDEAGPS